MEKGKRSYTEYFVKMFQIFVQKERQTIIKTENGSCSQKINAS